MPVGDRVLANDFVDVLKKKHAANAYKKMVSFLESCVTFPIWMVITTMVQHITLLKTIIYSDTVNFDMIIN